MDHVFFDAAGTLFRVRGTVGEVYSECAARFGLKGNPEEVGPAFVSAFRRRPPMAFGALHLQQVRERERQWWREVVWETFSELGQPGDFEKFFTTLYDLFASPTPWRLEPGCPEVISELRQRGKRIGIISNFDSRLPELLSALKILELFDTVTYSSALTSAKPDRRIFETALERAGALAEHSLHIGDDYQDDFLGARGAGMAALLYDPRGRYRGSVECDRIESLTESLAYLI